MNIYEKIRKTCRPIRILLGLILITIGLFTQNYLFFLGIVPLLAGVTDFCPLCILSKKCGLKK